MFFLLKRLHGSQTFFIWYRVFMYVCGHVKCMNSSKNFIGFSPCKIMDPHRVHSFSVKYSSANRMVGIKNIVKMR